MSDASQSPPPSSSAAPPQSSASEDVVTVTVNLTREAYEALEEIARYYNVNVTTALHRCIATTAELIQTRVMSQRASGLKSRGIG
jgi:hypothetical protein